MSEPEVLPCGRDALTAWEHAASATVDEHDLDCPHCAAVRAQHDALAPATADWQDVPVPVPGRLLDAVMGTVTRELRPSRRIAMPAAGPGAFVTELAVGNALRTVLDRDPAVVMRRCRVDDDGPGAVSVWLSLAVSYEHYTRHGGELVRSRVAAAVDQLFGLHATGVELDLVDVFTGPTGGGG